MTYFTHIKSLEHPEPMNSLGVTRVKLVIVVAWISSAPVASEKPMVSVVPSRKQIAEVGYLLSSNAI
jgi:hypothetical protein